MLRCKTYRPLASDAEDVPGNLLSVGMGLRLLRNYSCTAVALLYVTPGVQPQGVVSYVVRVPSTERAGGNDVHLFAR